MSTPGPTSFPEIPNPYGNAQKSAAPATDGQGNPYQSPQPEYVPPSPEQLVQVQLQNQLRPLFEAGRNGANWFYWAAGLSVINAVLQVCGANWHFIAGLAVVDIASGVGHGLATQHPDNAAIFYGIAIVIDLVAIGTCALFGWLSNQRWIWLMILGMVLYGLDGLLFLLFGDILPVAFHAFVLYQMYAGFSAFRKLNDLEQQIIHGQVPMPADVSAPPSATT
jgi:hypothetical protein